MIGLDTNVLVRYFVRDDRKQAAIAEELMDGLTTQAPGFVSVVSLVELSWVLGRSYDLDRADSVRRALALYRDANADLSDCVIARIGAESGCERTPTFDVRAARDAGMTLLGDAA